MAMLVLTPASAWAFLVASGFREMEGVHGLPAYSKGSPFETSIQIEGPDGDPPGGFSPAGEWVADSYTSPAAALRLRPAEPYPPGGTGPIYSWIGCKPGYLTHGGLHLLATNHPSIGLGGDSNGPTSRQRAST